MTKTKTPVTRKKWNSQIVNSPTRGQPAGKRVLNLWPTVISTAIGE